VRRPSIVKRTVVAVCSVIALIGFTVTMGGAAWSAASSSSTAVITFDDAAHQAVLTIPTPACPPSQPDCQWKFFLNEPKLSVDVATVFGTSGTLTIPYPKDFCGVIQADAYVGPPFVAKRGFQHTIEDCNPPPTTTTTAPPTTTTTTVPPTTTTTTTPPVISSAVTTPPPPPAPPTPPPATPVPAAPVSVPATTAAPAAPAQLPFTGRNIKPFLFIGLTLVVLGIFLLRPNESWRRTGRRLSAFSASSAFWPFKLDSIRCTLETYIRDILTMAYCTVSTAVGFGLFSETVTPTSPMAAHWARFDRAAHGRPVWSRRI
jgi:hypothetical protein